MQSVERFVLTETGLEALIDALRRDGHVVHGPTTRDGAIVYDEIDSIADLPRGVGDAQAPGAYRLVRRDDGALFGFAVGPQSCKKYLHPPVQGLWRATRDADGMRVEAEPVTAGKMAFLGVRACELNAIAIQDKVLTEGPYVDASYKTRRESAFVIAVNCAVASATCFCVSMGTGPAAKAGFDLAMTELTAADGGRFVVEAGSDAGRRMLAELAPPPATADDVAAAQAIIDRTARGMGRAMPDVDLRRLLEQNPDHRRWDEVAARCLSCANCTLVCPTCFCTTVQDTSDLAGIESARERRWDSCFSIDFSYLHGGAVRISPKSRYRQWMTHKLATWFDQFGTSGCVGCGRCITWCPVGIDITEEAQAIYADVSAREASHGDA
jgi:sulfhydrogenase subunit beta (sulfur reductase)